jgi:hypothetical protein
MAWFPKALRVPIPPPGDDQNIGVGNLVEGPLRDELDRDVGVHRLDALTAGAVVTSGMPRPLGSSSAPVVGGCG